METGIRETAANRPFTIDYEKVLEIQQQPWTIRTLGIEPQEESTFRKADFETDLKKVSRKRSIPIGENIRDAIRSIKGK